MKLFEKPWLEIINIGLDDIVATSFGETSGTDITNEEDRNTSELP